MRPALALFSRAGRRKPRGVSWERVVAAAQTSEAARLLPRLVRRPGHDELQRGLPLLEASARNSADVHEIGEFAVRAGVEHLLSARFLQKWLVALSKVNAFRAIHIWKRLPVRSAELGTSLYLAAGHVGRASELAMSLATVPRALLRELVAAALNTKEGRASSGLELAQAWIDRWQAPRPEDVRWLHHLARTTGVSLRLPPLDPAVRLPEARVHASERLQHLVSHINGVLVRGDLLEQQPEVHVKWLAAMADPTQRKLEDLVLATTRVAARADSGTDGLDEWTAVMRLVSARTAADVVRQLRLPARAIAAALSRAKSDADLALLLAAVRPESLYTRECLSALALRSPAALLELIVPPEVLELALGEHHLVALWRAGPADDVQQWLVPLTIKQPPSPRLLRAALHALAKTGTPAARETARMLLTSYGDRGLALDERIYKRGPEPKLPRATLGVTTRANIDAALLHLFPDCPVHTDYHK